MTTVVQPLSLKRLDHLERRHRIRFVSAGTLMGNESVVRAPYLPLHEESPRRVIESFIPLGDLIIRLHAEPAEEFTTWLNTDPAQWAAHVERNSILGSHFYDGIAEIINLYINRGGMISRLASTLRPALFACKASERPILTPDWWRQLRLAEWVAHSGSLPTHQQFREFSDDEAYPEQDQTNILSLAENRLMATMAGFRPSAADPVDAQCGPILTAYISSYTSKPSEVQTLAKTAGLVLNPKMQAAGPAITEFRL